MNEHRYAFGAAVAGGLLALMIFTNGSLADFTSPVWSSLIAHLVGIFGSWVLWRGLVGGKRLFPFAREAPLWSYFGGAAGGLIVVFANITVNSSIGLIGTVAMTILGQTIFALLFDYQGWLGMSRRKITGRDFGQVALILAGSILIILF